MRNKNLTVHAVLLWTVIYTSIMYGQAFQGYTLYSPFGGKNTYLLNMNNTVAKSWTHTKNGGYSAYLLEDGSVIRPALSTNSNLSGGGEAGVVQRVAWNGTMIWEYTYSSSTYRTHHDIEVLPNGNVLLIAWEVKTAVQAVQAGSMRNASFWPDHIIEVQPVGSTGGNIVWKWHAFDHLVQDYDATKSNYGVVADHPELLNINMTGNGPSGDWMHINGISYNPLLDQIVISSHNLNEIYVIDHSTTTAQAASHSGGRWGKGGDILYRWGKPANYKTAGTTIFDVVHCSWWIPQGLPGAGHILAFNNRASSGQSNIVEIVPPQDTAGNYLKTPGVAYGPASTFWNYTASGFFSNHLGGAQRLPNGNTIISEATSGYLFEVTANGTVVWNYSPGGQIPRVLRYAPDYPGLSNLTGGTLTKQVSLVEGWNIVSVPLNVSNFSVSTLFPTATSQAYGFNNGYATATTLEKGKGYWLRYPQATNITFSGTNPGTTINVNEGWNLIGGYQNDVSTSAISSAPAGIINSQYYGYSNGYTAATTLNPGKGYWVRASAAGTLTIPSSVEKNTTTTSLLEQVGTGKIVITDAVGNVQSLYLRESISESDLQSFALPPLSPAGIFDVRFSSNRILANSNESNVIELKDVTFPITISASGIKARITDIVQTGKIVNKILENNAAITINSPLQSLELSVLGTPEAFVLEQNFPNPFNPSTKIRLHLAKESRVQVVIYDVLGNEIASLLRDMLSSGSHEFEFGASQFKQLASGFYICRVTAGKEVKSIKMLYLK